MTMKQGFKKRMVVELVAEADFGDPDKTVAAVTALNSRAKAIRSNATKVVSETKPSPIRWREKATPAVAPPVDEGRRVDQVDQAAE